MGQSHQLGFTGATASSDRDVTHVHCTNHTGEKRFPTLAHEATTVDHTTSRIVSVVLTKGTGVYDDSLTHTPHNVQHSQQHSQHTSKKNTQDPYLSRKLKLFCFFFFSVKVAIRSGQRKLRQRFLPKKSAHFSFSLGSFFLYHKKWPKL